MENGLTLQAPSANLFDMEPVTITKKMSNAKWGVERSMLYHESRVFFWESLSFVSKLFEFLLNSAACVLLFDGSATFTKWFVLVSAILSFLAIIMNCSKRIKHNMAQKARYGRLLAKFPVDEDDFTKDILAQISKERLKIEEDESVILDCLNAVCHNKLCDVYDLPDEKWEVSLLCATVGRMIPIPHHPKRRVQE